MTMMLLGRQYNYETSIDHIPESQMISKWLLSMAHNDDDDVEAEKEEKKMKMSGGVLRGLCSPMVEAGSRS